MRHLKILPFILMLSLLGAIPAWATTFTYGTLTAHSPLTTQSEDDVTLTWGAGTNTSNSPQHNKSGYAKLYANNELTVSVPSGYTISEIAFAMSGSYTMDNCKVGDVAISNNKWSGTGSSITIVNKGTAQTRIRGIEVTYAASGGSNPTLSVSPATIDFGTVEQGATVNAEDVTVTFANLTGSVSYSGLSGAFAATGSISSTGDKITITPSTSTIGEYEQTLTVQSTADSKSANVTVTMKVVEPFNGLVLTFPDYNDSEISSYTASWTATKSGQVWNIVNFNNNKNGWSLIKAGRNGNASVATITTQVQDHAVSEVTVTVAGVTASNINSHKLYVADNASFNDAIEINGIPVTMATGDVVYTVPVDNRDNDLYYKLVYDCASGSSNGFLQISKITYAYAAATPQKTPAGLAYDAADAQKLAKIGEAFTAPTLTNPHSLTVSYESDNTSVAEVASNGAITIKATGKAVVTASFGGNDDYKSGSASYTIFVASEAGTAADPLTEASAKTLIDDGCTLTAHVNGVIATASYNSTYFNYSITLTNGFQFYRLKDLGNADFSSDYLGAGDEVTAVGPLGMHNTTYQLGEGCYLTFYEQATTPLTPIANTKETAYSVATALGYAAAPTTYDLSDHVYIAGVVYKVNSFNSTNGTYNIYIKDAGTSEDDGKFEFFKCSGLYQVGETVVPFAEGDVQEGDEVIGYGVMTYYTDGSIWEFGQPNQLVSLNRPAVAVTGIDLTESTAEVEEGETVTLHAAVVPGNASDKEIVWSVQSGNDKASVNQSGVVTGVAAGTAVIRAASHEDAIIYEECTVTVTAADPTKHTVTFDATVDTGDSPLSKSNITFACSNGVLDNGTEYRLYGSSTTTFECSVGNITKIEFTGVSGKPISNFEDPAVGTLVTDGNDGVWTGNAASVAFTASAQVRATEIKVTYKEDSRAESGLVWNPADDMEITVGETFTAPMLQNPNNIAASEITITSSNTNLATVTAGVVSLVANATGEATITATFAGNDDYKPATVSYKITVSEPNVTFDSSVDHAESGETTLTKSGFTLSFTSGVLDGAQAEYRLYKGYTMTLSSTDYLIKKIEFTCTSGNPISGFADAAGLDKTNSEWTGESNTVELTASGAQVRMTKIKVFYVEDPRAASGLAWSTDEVELTLGETFVAANLVNPNSIAAGEITITSSNTNLATVTAGVVSLVDDAIGTATITATFAGNATYKPASVSYSITVLDPTPAIITEPASYLNWGTVNKGTIPTDKTIAVTLHFLSSVDADLDDQDGVFNIDKYSNIVDGDVITVSVVNTNTLGTHSATLTLSDGWQEAQDKVITLSVTIEDPETPVSTTSKWVAATEITNNMQVLIVGEDNSTFYAMSEDRGNNRGVDQVSIDEGVLTPGANTMAFTLVAQTDGTYAIKTSNNKYLYAGGTGNSNYLNTQAYSGDLDANAKWNIDLTNSTIIATSTNRNEMRFNKSNNPKIISCYQSTSTYPTVALYVRKYAVIISSTIENGTVTASPSMTDVGETVTLTATADPDYMLKSISVRTEVGGSIVSILNNTFTMPAENVVVNATFEHIPTPTYYLKNNWNGCDATWEAMTKDGDNYKLENVIYGGSGIYYNNKADDDGAVFKPYADIKYLDGTTAKVVEAYDTVNFVLDPANGTILAEMLNKDTVVTYTVAGNSLALFDLGWAATHPYKYTDMKKQTDGNYKWDNGGRSVVLPAGNVEIKVVKSRDYAKGSWPADPFVYNIKESGEFMINIYYNPCSHDIWIDTTLVEPLNIQSLSITGSWDNWEAVKPFTLGSENDKALVTLSLTAGTTYQFKLQDGQDKYYGDGFAFTRDNISHQGIEAQEAAAAVNMTINVDKTGEYLFTYFFDTEQLLVMYPGQVPAEKIAPLSGKFTINQDGDTAVFSRGNLQYNYEANEWYAAEKQYEVLGDLNLRFGDNTYQGSIDLFGWSCESSDFGKQWKYKDEDFTGAFVDWGTLFAGGEKEWSTLTESEWTFIMNRKKGNNKLWTMIAIGPDSLNGLALIPDDWTAPACASNLVYGFYNVDDKVNYKKNSFTFEQWAELEASGIVFIPLAGARAGYYGNNWSGSAVSDLDNPIGSGYDWVDNANWMGYYWLSTSNTTTQAATAILPGWHDNKWNVPTIWKREKRRGQPVRLVTRIPVKEVVRANLSNGKWGTLCPKQNVEKVEGATFYQIAYLEEQNGVPFNMVWDEISGTTLTAGQPYFFIANATAIRGYKTGDAVTSGSNTNGFYGYIGDENLDLPNWHINYEPGNDNTFVIYNNKVTRIDGATELYSERCYININATEPTRQVKPQQSAALHRLVMGISGADAPTVTTGIDQMVNGKCQNGKLIIDGHLFIIRGEKMFDATGRLVK